MNSEQSIDNITIAEQSEVEDYRAGLAADVLRGLSLPGKELQPKYFYDEIGSQLFEKICELPEYYQTRTESAILRDIAPELIEHYRPATLVEFGSGSSLKTRLLLSAMENAGVLKRYVPIDISREMLLSAAESLVREYPGLGVDAVIGDFNAGLPPLTAPGPRLIIFLGSTIGNFTEEEATAFLRRVAAGMGEDDLFLLGIDLVKDPAMLHAAYNDADGVTAEFNLNVLRVINRELGGAFDTGTFRHYAFFNPRASQIEMHLASLEEQIVPIASIGVDVRFGRGETILTEISRKFTPGSARALMAAAGMNVLDIFTDSGELFALALARREKG
ncbi:MAG: L-histidine N(alpha)-methyltransferase [Bacteroidota bacterium]